MDMVSKMKRLTDSPLGSRLASVHNGSSLFTGDAGSGESNIRRYVIENDWLEAIIQLPNNLFYNTGITTYIWVLSNNKPAHRKGKVQLLDASKLYRKLRKNLGAKNCEFAPSISTTSPSCIWTCHITKRAILFQQTAPPQIRTPSPSRERAGVRVSDPSPKFSTTTISVTTKSPSSVPCV